MRRPAVVGKAVDANAAEKATESKGKSAPKSSGGSASPKARSVSKGPTAVVLYDFDAEDDNEMSVKKGDVVTDVEVVSGDWTRCSLRGKRGAVPTTYVKVGNNEDDESAAAGAAPTQPEDIEDGAEPHDDDSDMSSDDELLEDGTKQPVADYRKRWRGSLLMVCDWEQVGGDASRGARNARCASNPVCGGSTGVFGVRCRLRAHTTSFCVVFLPQL